MKKVCSNVENRPGNKEEREISRNERRYQERAARDRIETR
jgi:hypothetical protein